MKGKAIGVVVALACVTAALGVPGTAEAHTGSVICDSRGVVFTYNANFERRTAVTETVGAAGEVGAQRLVFVDRHVGSTDIWAGVTGTIVASAKWDRGGITQVTLVCPKPPPPPVAPPVAPPPPPVAPPPAAPPAPPAVVTPPAVPATPVTTPATPAVAPKKVKPPVKAPKCPKGTTRNTYNAKTGVLVCLRIVHDTSKPGVGGRTHRTPKHHGGGVTGRFERS